MFTVVITRQSSSDELFFMDFIGLLVSRCKVGTGVEVILKVR
jgi:hypothetical protein